MSEMSTKAIWVSRLISLTLASLIVLVAYTGADTVFHNPDIINGFSSNLGHMVHVLAWILLVLACFGMFGETPKTSMWWSVPLMILWICALAFANWPSALAVYVVISIVASIKRFI